MLIANALLMTGTLCCHGVVMPHNENAYIIPDCAWLP